MKYGITKTVLGDPGFIEIDEVEYERIKEARANLLEILLLEENLDLVTENFQEYEAELLSIASRNTVFHDSDYYSMSRERIIVCRRIVNLLSACKMYLDQSIHHLNKIYGENSHIANAVELETSSQYNKSFGYRVMEALRNYVQHRGFPIHTIIFSGQWLDIESEEKSRLLHTVIPRIDVSELVQDNKFKKTVLREMLKVQEKNGIDIRPLIRDYVEGIGKIHERIRELMLPDLDNWENIINNTIDKYQTVYGSEVSLAGLAIVAEQEDTKWVETKTIFKELIERRRTLEKKNKVFANLRKRYASNEIRKKDA